MTPTTHDSKRIAVTMGDPSGIGPEILVTSLNRAPDELVRRVVVFGDVCIRTELRDDVAFVASTTLADEDRRPGQPTPGGGRAQLAYIDAAIDAALAGEAGAIVTAPISKTQVRAAGFAFDGHTEYLAHRFDASPHAMMFAGPTLKVALATVHVALRDVAERLTTARIADVARLLAASLREDFGCASPRVGVVGLNPHAGEGGLFGREDVDVIAPAVAACRDQGMACDGPLVPDAAFRAAADGAYDGLVAMYHDQALIPLKLVDFESAVNVTLGLPIVRTSPDHGVAYDIAGSGAARPDSFAAALALAAQMVDGRAR